MTEKKKRRNNLREKAGWKKILDWALRKMAVAILEKHKPKIIAITGSIGKTSAKEAIVTVLAPKFRIRKSEKNYNNEIGVPLTIIGTETGGRSIFRWISVFIFWLKEIFSKDYPEILVLELGADRSGDIKYLTSFIKPDIAVMTDISSSHLEYFKTIEAIVREKSQIVKALSDNGLAILNIDNPHISKLAGNLKQNGSNAKIISFGFSESAEVRASDVFLNYSDESDLMNYLDKNIGGLSFKLNYGGTVMPMRLNNILARHNIYAALAGVSVGIGMGLNPVEIGANLENFVLPSGRTNLIKGIKDTYIIDDTYNSSTLVSVEGALEVLREFSKQRKIAVMGDILEIGANTEQEHRLLAKKFLEIGGNVFFSVGKRMKFAVDELRKHKFDGEIFEFAGPVEAGKHLQVFLQKGDTVLVKGSQGMRMEKIVEEIMAEPERAGELLCRQDAQWKNKPWTEV